MKGKPDPFEALADPTRRSILVMLRRGKSHTAGAIAEAFPEISRPAVSRHLRVLREAGLVTADHIGRENQYRLNASVFSRLYRDWFKRFDPIWGTALTQLKARVEEAAPSRRSASELNRRKSSI